MALWWTTLKSYHKGTKISWELHTCAKLIANSLILSTGNVPPKRWSHANKGKCVNGNKSYASFKILGSFVIVVTLYSQQNRFTITCPIILFVSGIMLPCWLIFRLQSPCHQSLVSQLVPAPRFFGHPYRLDPQHRRTPHASRPREKALEFGSALAGTRRRDPRPKDVNEVAHV